MITYDAIYTKVRAAVLAVSANAYVTRAYVPKPESFPAVFIRGVGKFTPTNTRTFANTQNVSDITIEAQIFSNLKSGAIAEAETLYNAVRSALKNQYFYEVNTVPIDNEDTSIYRLKTTFRRVLADSDALNT